MCDFWEVLTHFRYGFQVSDGLFFSSVDRPQCDWFHVVINFIGAEEGAEAYIDGRLQSRRAKYKQAGRHTAGAGRVVVGRFSTEQDLSYTSLEMDELLFVNQTLTTEEITSLNNIQ